MIKQSNFVPVCVPVPLPDVLFVLMKRTSGKGTHTGTAFYDTPPSGDPVEINGTAILRIRDGQIVEHWGGPHCQQGLGLIC